MRDILKALHSYQIKKRRVGETLLVGGQYYRYETRGLGVHCRYGVEVAPLKRKSYGHICKIRITLHAYNYPTIFDGYVSTGEDVHNMMRLAMPFINTEGIAKSWEKKKTAA